MNSRPHIPRATYRLQLSRSFTFRQAADVVPYLAALGISHCYISPCLKARSGSTHGYDIVAHDSLNPEIGTPEDFEQFVAVLHKHEMGLILDIVPNHMGVMGNDNQWWLDVLENGESSVYANYFDIDWHPLKEELHGKVLVPALHDHYGAVLESGELKLQFAQTRGEFDIWYRTHRFPIDPREYPRILNLCSSAVLGRNGSQEADVLEFESLLTAFGHIPSRKELSADRIAERKRDKEIHKRRLAELCARSPEIADCIHKAVERINGNPADPASFEELHELIKAQTFRLANWRVASDDINYRRFFDTNDLAGIRVEHDEVFKATHQLVITLLNEGKADGVRIDHPDGLYDPAQYFKRLHDNFAKRAPSDDSIPQTPWPYVVVEKILTGSELLPADWPVSGTTGYEFGNLVNGLFVDTSAARRMERIYHNFIGDDVDVDDLAYHCKTLIIRSALVSELNVLANQITRIALSKRRTCDFTLNSLRDALAEIVACFPVYRTYVSPAGISVTDEGYIRTAVTAAKRRSPAADSTVFDFIRDVLLTCIAEGQDAAYRDAVTAFAMKFQQFTSPVMAKGLEDTAFYRYNKLVSLNEVGSDLHRFGTGKAEFHRANENRLRDWPHTMLTTGTHDSKRSEDVRARINVLADYPGLWRLRLREWSRLNREHKRLVNDLPAPSGNDEYLLYQTLLGVWPSQPVVQQGERDNLRERVENYMLKAIREAKENTSWINRNEEYEGAMLSFVRALLRPEGRFLADFLPFQRRIARLGCWNSLSQALLKLTSPGVPDTYQGNEVWDFSLVDPDNRRPVDYAHDRELFDQMAATRQDSLAELISHLIKAPEDGRIKMFLIWKTLCFRRAHPEVFERGSYSPAIVTGPKASHIISFSRKCGSTTVLIAVPRLIGILLGDNECPPVGRELWADTRLVLPKTASVYSNAFTGEALSSSGSRNEGLVADLLAKFPVALLVSE